MPFRIDSIRVVMEARSFTDTRHESNDVAFGRTMCTSTRGVIAEGYSSPVKREAKKREKDTTISRGDSRRNFYGPPDSRRRRLESRLKVLRLCDL